MKLLFLDFDGVLNSAQSDVYHLRGLGRSDEFGMPVDFFCPLAISNLNFVCEMIADLNVVISSSWRTNRDVCTLRKILTSNGFLYSDRVLDKTPYLSSSTKTPWGDMHRNVIRGEEVQAWLDENTKVSEQSCLMPKFQVDDIVILDDDEEFGALDPKLIRTNPVVGFMWNDVLTLLERLKPDWMDHVHNVR